MVWLALQCSAEPAVALSQHFDRKTSGPPPAAVHLHPRTNKPCAFLQERRASVTTPGISTNKGDLTFQVVEGKRIGYSIGNNKTMFDELAKTDTVMAEQVQAAYKTGQLSASVQCNAVSNLESAFTGKLDGAVKPLQEKLNSLEKKIETTDKKLESTEGKITEAKAAADPVYWLDNRVDTDEAEERGKTFVAPGQSTTLKLTGVGFEPRFHPLSGGQLACGFAPKDSKLKKATSHGDIRAEAIAGKVYYHVECPTPSYPLGAVVTVTLAEHDGKAIPLHWLPDVQQIRGSRHTRSDQDDAR